MQSYLYHFIPVDEFISGLQVKRNNGKATEFSLSLRNAMLSHVEYILLYKNSLAAE